MMSLVHIVSNTVWTDWQRAVMELFGHSGKTQRVKSQTVSESR